MARRPRIDSAAAAVAVVAAAGKDIAPPVKLAKAAMPFWNAIIAARPKSEWNDADLVTASRLAKAEAAIEGLSEHQVVEFDKLARLSLAIRRSLGLDVRGKDGRASNVASRREQAFEIERAATEGDAAGLLN